MPTTTGYKWADSTYNTYVDRQAWDNEPIKDCSPGNTVTTAPGERLSVVAPVGPGGLGHATALGYAFSLSGMQKVVSVSFNAADVIQDVYSADPTTGFGAPDGCHLYTVSQLTVIADVTPT